MHKEEWNYVGTGEHHVKWCKPGLKGQKSHISTHVKVVPIR
jgi:hypothetical protein